MMKLLSTKLRCRTASFYCLTVFAFIHLIWILRVLSRKNLKVTSHHLQPNATQLIQDILFNASGYDDMFTRDPNVTCKYPMGNPLDKQTMRNYQKKTIRCFYPTDDLAIIDMGGLRIKSEMLRKNEYCFFSEITRPLLEDTAYTSLRVPLVGTVHPQSDFIKIECIDENSNLVFMDFLAHAQHLPYIEAMKNNDQYSVAVLGIGFMSRLSFMKQMPRSYNYLKNRLRSTELLGFAVGESSTPYKHIMDMVKGNESFVSTNFGDFKEDKIMFEYLRLITRIYFCPDILRIINLNHIATTATLKEIENPFSGGFIWDHFSDAGAVTLFSEDQPNMQIFEMNGLPLKRKPAHHYGNTFWAAINGSLIQKRSQQYCFGKRPYYWIHFRYLLSFMRTYQNSSSFLFSLYNELTRNDINMAQVMDDDFVELLKTMVKEDLLDHTILIILGNHDPGNPELTAGKMPLVSIILPQSAPIQWKQALKVNRKKLTSTYDIYQTFVQILGTFNVSKPKIRLLRKNNPGTSLFTEISPNRSCQDVLLANEWCPC